MFAVKRQSLSGAYRRGFALCRGLGVLGLDCFFEGASVFVSKDGLFQLGKCASLRSIAAQSRTTQAMQ